MVNTVNKQFKKELFHLHYTLFDHFKYKNEHICLSYKTYSPK
ncbi:hypothetical protein HMPREF0766_10170 [Sphingobacterium spiritivorum ATCC 33861]|uniref:Uncharacterized protein n=1 Tax=Sphingobacterium spiritivorum ATCC 33861 TaxID=525373 RepID=D7VGQ1_SPHSI|nr:hypothetical protein HMPREF0766_10170 [Sphingobacterium spiritivorum ATCC 33861]